MTFDQYTYKHTYQTHNTSILLLHKSEILSLSSSYHLLQFFISNVRTPYGSISLLLYLNASNKSDIYRIGVFINE